MVRSLDLARLSEKSCVEILQSDSHGVVHLVVLQGMQVRHILPFRYFFSYLR